MYNNEENGSIADYQNAELHILTRLETELDVTLSYHGYHHTLDVLNAAMQIADAENISVAEKKLLRIAVAFHDAGFIYVYRGHEEMSCKMVNETLPSFGFSKEQLSVICGMIMATKIPQRPKTIAEKIIADADLDYLGREDVFSIAQTLFDELKTHENITDEGEWCQVQIGFLKTHQYHTSYMMKHREQPKLNYLEQLLNNIR